MGCKSSMPNNFKGCFGQPVAKVQFCHCCHGGLRFKSSVFEDGNLGRLFHRAAWCFLSVQCTMNPRVRSFKEIVYRNFWLPEVALYCAGFPCQPFSTLNAASSFFEEEQSKPLFKVVERVKRSQPGVSWMVYDRCCIASLSLEFAMFATSCGLHSRH